MTQTKKQSLAEACVNVVIGYIIAVGGQLILFPLFGVKSSIGQNLWIGLGFTIISLVRSYLIRRYFNNK